MQSQRSVQVVVLGYDFKGTDCPHIELLLLVLYVVHNYHTPS